MLDRMDSELEIDPSTILFTGERKAKSGFGRHAPKRVIQKTVSINQKAEI